MSDNDEFGADRLSKIGKELYLKPDKADVHFVFESDERIPAHKIILSSASKVFNAMFYGKLKEEGDVEIVDASAEAFKEFLRFFYTNHVKLTIENISEVMYLVQKYDVMDCLSLCANFLLNKVTTENVCSILHSAIMCEQKGLVDLCESEISFHFHEVLKSSAFVKCTRQVLNRFLNMDQFSRNETEVFEACMSWVRTLSGVDKLTRDIVLTHLGDLFYNIRFGSMSHDEFVKLLQTYGELFSMPECIKILQLISRLEMQPKLFKCSHRLIAWDEDQKIQCIRDTGDDLVIGASVNISEVTKHFQRTRIYCLVVSSVLISLTVKVPKIIISRIYTRLL